MFLFHAKPQSREVFEKLELNQKNNFALLREILISRQAAEPRSVWKIGLNQKNNFAS